jgi:hypothetical protein
MAAPLDTIAAHRAFWNREACAKPLVSFRIGDTLVARHFAAARSLLTERTTITPGMIVVDDYIADYERMWGMARDIGQSGIWTGEPYTGMPWMEAMLGCVVHGSASALVTEPCVSTLEELQRVRLDPDNPWLRKYREMTARLVELSAGRFPVGQPIMRGPSDIVGALIGQTAMIYLLNDAPEEMAVVFQRIGGIFRDVIAAQQKLVPPYAGGYAFGFYHLWAPGRCMWFQEDLSALFSPQYYRRFLRAADDAICAGYDYTLMHLHPSSFFIVDDLLADEGLRAVQVNKDVGGPSVEDMLPTLRRIQERKNLVLWGEITRTDVALLMERLPERRMHLSIVSPTVDEARRIMDLVNASR